MKNKLDFVDCLRGYAILGVVFTHSAQVVGDLPTWLKNIGIQGARGVQLFFIMSAFTLLYSLYRKYDTRKFEIGDFFLRRFFRIAPAFYFALIFYSAVDLLTYNLGLSEQTNSYTFGTIFSALTFTNILNIDWLYSLVPGGWSISAEMLFYLTVPFIFMYVKSLKRAVILVITTLVVSIGSNQIALKMEIGNPGLVRNEYLFHWFPNQLPIFCLGILLFFLLKNRLLGNPPIKKTSKLTSNVFIFLSVMGISILSVLNGVGGTYFPSHILFGICFVGLAYGLANLNKHFLINKISKFIGEVSFSLYLIHFFVLDVITMLIGNKIQLQLSSSLSLVVIYGLTLLTSTFLAYISYRLIEQPGIKLGRKISVSIEKQKESTIAAKID